MKKLVGFTLALSLSAGVVYAQGITRPMQADVTAAGDGIVGSVHDMNVINGLTQDTQGRVCAFCHTPHHALTSVDAEDNLNADTSPLWSHQFVTTSQFTPYRNATLDADVFDPLAGPSRLCMSCHDGVIAADQHYGAGAGTNERLGSDGWGGAAVGLRAADQTLNFGNDHPIGFGYAAVVAKNSTNGLQGKQGIKAKSNVFYGNSSIAIRDVLFNGDIMTCATCHDVHNKNNIVSNPTMPTPDLILANTPNYLVYSPQYKSQLCLSCHDKGDPTK